MLERTIPTLGLRIRYEPIFQNGEPWQSDGGLCRLLEENVVIVNSLAPPAQKCLIILAALKRHDKQGLRIPPEVRTLLKKNAAALPE